MRNRAISILAVLNVALLASLGVLWIAPSGALRDVDWVRPAPLPADLSGLVPALAQDRPQDSSRFLAMLERPLFTASRRPPPPPPPEVPPPPPDHLSTARLTGIVRGEAAGAGYAILLVDGKQRRVQQNQQIEGWTLKALADRQAMFSRGDQTQTLTMQRADVSKYGGLAQPVAAAAQSPERRNLGPAVQGSAVANTVTSGGGEPNAATGTDAPVRQRPPPRFGP